MPSDDRAVRNSGAVDDLPGRTPVDKKARKLVIELLNAELKRIAFDANLFDRGLADYAKARWASERRQQVKAALEQVKEDEVKQPDRKETAKNKIQTQMEMFSQ
jgi:uncharacterized protein YqgQ